MATLPTKIDDLLISLVEKIGTLRNTTGINHPEIQKIQKELHQNWRRTFLAMRQALNEVANEIGAAHKVELNFRIRKYEWGEMASAMDLLKQLAPGDETTPNGAERVMRRAKQINGPL